MGSLTLPHQTLFQKCPSSLRNSIFYPQRLRILRRGPPFRFQASLAVATDPDSCVQPLSSEDAQNDALKFDLFSCPVCYEPLIRKGPPGLNLATIYRSGFKCQRCNKTFSSKDVFLDLTVTAGTKDFNEFKPARTELFRSPLVSFLYERGWRQNFNQSGFPGPDEEVISQPAVLQQEVNAIVLQTCDIQAAQQADPLHDLPEKLSGAGLEWLGFGTHENMTHSGMHPNFKMAQEYFKPALGGLLVDVSCGSGLFSRKFAKSGAYSGVIALDFSENMLRQCNDFISKDESLSNANIALVRADVSRLPFSSGSVDAVHAGAALHCWPSPSNAVAEISRILRSGGVFVATTFLAPTIGDSFASEILTFLRQNVAQGTNTYNNLTEKEIEDLCKICGLVNYTCDVRRSFIIFSAQKP